MSVDLIDRFYDGHRSPDLPFVEGDAVRVAHGEYAGRLGEVVVLAYAEVPLKYLVEFGDGTDEQFLAGSLMLIGPNT